MIDPDRGQENLRMMFAQADVIDYTEGMMAWERYHQVMEDLAKIYRFPIERITAAFCAMSPNNDYAGNLRSVLTLLHGLREGWPLADIECSTYRHCLIRAHAYMTGEEEFMTATRGRKIRSFYMNILHPEDGRYVTVDGHVCAAWRGQRLTMKQAIVKGKAEYDAIEQAIRRLSFREYVRPNEYQAILWFVRKRVFQIKAEMHKDLFTEGDVWKTYKDVRLIQPFRRRVHGKAKAEDDGRGDLPLFRG